MRTRRSSPASDMPRTGDDPAIPNTGDVPSAIGGTAPSILDGIIDPFRGLVNPILNGWKKSSRPVKLAGPAFFVIALCSTLYLAMRVATGGAPIEATAPTAAPQVLSGCINPSTGQAVPCGQGQTAQPTPPTTVVCIDPTTGQAVVCGQQAPTASASAGAQTAIAFGCNAFACATEEGIWLYYPAQERGENEANSYNFRGRWFYYALGFEDAPGKAWPDALEQSADQSGLFACVWVNWLGSEIQSLGDPEEITVPWEIFRNCGGQ